MTNRKILILALSASIGARIATSIDADVTYEITSKDLDLDIKPQEFEPRGRGKGDRVRRRQHWMSNRR